MVPADERSTIAAGAGAVGVELSERQLDQLTGYMAELRVWATRINLLSRADLPLLAIRHVVDSLAPVPYLRGRDPSMAIADLGSGGGLPGIPLAIVLAPRRMTLIEPRQRKASFLRAAIRALALEGCEVACGRAEELGSEHAAAYDAVVSRASLRNPELLAAAGQLLVDGGELHAFRGPNQPVTAREEAAAHGLEPIEPIRYRLPGSSTDLRIERWKLHRRGASLCST